MKLRINKLKKLKRAKLVKSGIIIGGMVPLIFTGCNNVDTSYYYLVHNNNTYYICTKSEKYVNSCDIEYKSIIDGNIIGSVCTDNNDFDYQIHHLSTDFLSKLQICNLKDVLNSNSVSYDYLKDLANSDDINELGDEYFENREYYFNYDLTDNYETNLKIYETDSNIILGYDISPKRLEGTYDYVYSIIDKDVIKLSDYDVKVHDISKYFNDSNYITYDTALNLSNNDQLIKVLTK